MAMLCSSYALVRPEELIFHSCRLTLIDLIGPYPKQLQVRGSEGRADGRVGGVASARYHEAADTSGIVTGIKGVPGTVQKHLHTARKIHRSVDHGHAYITQVPSGIASGN